MCTVRAVSVLCKLINVVLSNHASGDIILFRSSAHTSPAVGSLRFLPPVAPTSWTRPLNCTAVPAVCPQDHVLPGQFQGDEGRLLCVTSCDRSCNMCPDCLFVDVYRPNNATASSNLPVMLLYVWYFPAQCMHYDRLQHPRRWLHWWRRLPAHQRHGLHNGSHLALHRNVIVVTMQYRCVRR